MANDNVIASAAVGSGAVFRSYAEASGVEWPACVLAYPSGGSAGAWTLQPVDTSHGLPVAVVGTVPVSGAFWQATQPVSAAQLPAALSGGGNLPVYLAELAAPVPVTDNGGSLTVDGAVAVSNFPATQPVSAAALPLPAGAAQEHTGAASYHSARLTDGAAFYAAPAAAQLPAALTGSGNLKAALVESTATVAVSGTFWQATQPVSGTVTANQGGAPWSNNVTQLAGTAVDTNSGVKSAGTLRVVIATDQPQLTNALKVDGSAVTQPVSGTVTANQGGAPWTVQDQAATSGGLSVYSFLSTAAVQAAAIKASAGQVYGLHFFNNTATIAYVRLYNQTASPATTDTPVYRALIPANTGGAGFAVAIPPGVAFGTGIGIRVTAGAADADATALAASAVLGNVFYK